MQRYVKALSGSVLLTIMTLSMPGMALAAQNHVMAPRARQPNQRKCQ
jgi:hypothetical protein